VIGTRAVECYGGLVRPADLAVEDDGGNAEAYEALEHRLVEVRVACETHVLDDGRQLVMVAQQDDPLQAAALVLHGSGEEKRTGEERGKEGRREARASTSSCESRRRERGRQGGDRK